MIVQSDPLAQAASTWAGRAAGPPCRACKTNLAEGHRYYPEGEAVVHYCCRAREEAPELVRAPPPPVLRAPSKPAPAGTPVQGDLFGNLGPEPDPEVDDELGRLFGGLV